MTMAEISLMIGIVGGILAVIGAIISYVWSANKMAFYAGQFLAKVDNIGDSFARFEKSFEKHMEEEEASRKAMWDKIDNHGDTLIEHEQRLGVVEKNYDR